MNVISIYCRFLLAACLVALAVVSPLGARADGVITPIRPPAVPLITRSPYVNTWLDSTTATLPGTWPVFWDGQIKGMTGMAYIDGHAWLFLGAPGDIDNKMKQTGLRITPTQSIFHFAGGGVDLTVDFLSPVEAKDVRRLSMPLAYISATARSSDGQPHDVRVYFDISGEWASGDLDANVRWWNETTGGPSPKSLLRIWKIERTEPRVLAETNDYENWGTALLSTSGAQGLTYQGGSDRDVRSQFFNNGVLADTTDKMQPRAVNDRWPVIAFCRKLGTVTTGGSNPFMVIIGQVRDPAVSYLGANVPPLWKSYWPNANSMLAFAASDAGAAFKRADAFDKRLNADATAAGGTHYAALTAITLRQAFAGTELVGAKDNPWLFLKEISSDGNVSTIDVVYPAMPVFVYANPELLRLMLEPLFDYVEDGHWPQPFAEHDLGASYPNASAHNDGGGENMPVEESANMLIMADAYLRAAPSSARAPYALRHYKILKQWADYLLTKPAGVDSPNALDPQYQNQTDDFTGQIAHSVNLALKAIIAVGAMGQIAGFAGNDADAAYYSRRAHEMIAQWAVLAQNSASTHLLLQYREPANAYSMDTTGESDDTWSLKYNGFADKMLGLDLIPESIWAEEAAYYKTQETPNGIAMDNRHSYTKADWELWTAAGVDDPKLRQDIIDEVYQYANTSNCATPLPDWYDPKGSFTGFAARPVMGGAIALLVRKQIGTIH